jgi:hypothetical protein
MTDACTRAIPLLERDVADTLGERYRGVVREATTYLDDYGEGDDERLVENVQQEFHDTFVDTVWPACPRHRTHPLWYHGDGRWWCERDGVALCGLGELGTLSTRG